MFMSGLPAHWKSMAGDRKRQSLWS